MTEILTRTPRTAAFAWGYNSSGGLGLGHAARAAMPAVRACPVSANARSAYRRRCRLTSPWRVCR
jgi:hypothetical protein